MSNKKPHEKPGQVQSLSNNKYDKSHQDNIRNSNRNKILRYKLETIFKHNL